jgi:hypothetical protein
MNNLKQKWKDLSKQEESLEQELSKFLGVKVMSIETRGYIPCVTIDHYQIYTLFKDNHAIPKVKPISLSVKDVAIARATQAKVQYVFDMLHSSIWEK